MFPIAVLLIVLCAAPWMLQAWISWNVRARVYTQIQATPAMGVALVLGAGLWRDGSPTPVLYDRVATAVELYKAGSVKKLLMSGDSQIAGLDEPEAMRRLAIELGVPDDDIVLDLAGRRTYDSCFRARHIFAVKRLTVVTQRFHLTRALFLCAAMGIDAVGVAADRREYRPASRRWWQSRELAAVVKAWLDVHLLHPQPVLGDKLPIDIT